MMRTPFFISGERFRIDDAGGLRGEADVKRDVVRAGDDFIESNQANAVFACDGGGDERIAADDLETETARAA